jgi:hypothetical protein
LPWRIPQFQPNVSASYNPERCGSCDPEGTLPTGAHEWSRKPVIALAASYRCQLHAPWGRSGAVPFDRKPTWTICVPA